MKIYSFILQIKKIKYEMKCLYWIWCDWLLSDSWLRSLFSFEAAGCCQDFAKLMVPRLLKPSETWQWWRMRPPLLVLLINFITPGKALSLSQIWIHLFSGLGLNCWTGLESVEDPARWKQCDLKRGFRTCYTKYDPRRLNVLSSDSTVWRWRGEQFI